MYVNIILSFMYFILIQKIQNSRTIQEPHLKKHIFRNNLIAKKILERF